MGHTDLATYSNTGQAVDKWTAESAREMVMDCSRRGREDGDGCWHIEGEPQHWQRLADELNLNGIVNGTANGTTTGHVPTDDGTVPIDALNAGRGAGLATSYGKD